MVQCANTRTDVRRIGATKRAGRGQSPQRCRDTETQRMRNEKGRNRRRRGTEDEGREGRMEEVFAVGCIIARWGNPQRRMRRRAARRWSRRADAFSARTAGERRQPVVARTNGRPAHGSRPRPISFAVAPVARCRRISTYGENASALMVPGRRYTGIGDKHRIASNNALALFGAYGGAISVSASTMFGRVGAAIVLTTAGHEALSKRS